MNSKPLGKLHDNGPSQHTLLSELKRAVLHIMAAHQFGPKLLIHSLDVTGCISLLDCIQDSLKADVMASTH